MYVFHAFALALDRVGLAAWHPLARCAVYLAFTLVVAWLSWTLFESRLNAFKERFPYVARSAASGVREAA